MATDYDLAKWIFENGNVFRGTAGYSRGEWKTSASALPSRKPVVALKIYEELMANEIPEDILRKAGTLVNGNGGYRIVNLLEAMIVSSRSKWPR